MGLYIVKSCLLRLELRKGRVTGWGGERDRSRFEERWCGRGEREWRVWWEVLWRCSCRAAEGLREGP